MQNKTTNSQPQKVVTSDFILNMHIRENKLFLNLEIINKANANNDKIISANNKINSKKFIGVFTLQELQPQLKTNFKDLYFIMMYMVERQNIQVNTQTGKIDIVMNADLPNGNKIKFGNSGSLQLHEHCEDDDIIDKMEAIVKICENDRQLNDQHIKTIIKGLAKSISHIRISQSKKQSKLQTKTNNNHNQISNLQTQLNNSNKMINQIKRDMALLKQNDSQNNKKYTEFIQNYKKQLSQNLQKIKKQAKQQNNYIFGGFKIETNQQFKKLQKKIENLSQQLKQQSKKNYRPQQKVSKESSNNNNKSSNDQIETFKKQIILYVAQKIKQFQDMQDAKINSIHDTLNEVSKQTSIAVQILYNKSLYPNLEKPKSSSQVTYFLNQQLKKTNQQLNQKKSIGNVSLGAKISTSQSLKSAKTTQSSNSTSASWNLFSSPSTTNIVNKLQYIDKSTKFYDKFNIENNTRIIYKGLDKKSTVLFGKTPISQSNQFKVKIIKTSGRAIGFGVVDAAYCHQRQVRNQPNFIQYWAYDGMIWEGPSKAIKSEGGGIKQGETVTVKVGLKMGGIEWIVDGKVRASISTTKFIKNDIKWVPLIVMTNTDDCVQWIPR